MTQTNPTISALKTSSFLVGDWVIEPDKLRFCRDEESHRVDPKIMDLMVLLASRPGHVFSRDEIFEAIWPNVIVGEDTLAKTVSRLRKSLGDQAGSASYIETIPKRGYSLIASVTPATPSNPVKKPLLGRSRLVLAGLSATVLIGVATVFATSSTGLSNTSAELQADQGHSELTSRADDLYMRFTRADNEAAIALYEQALADNPDAPLAQAGLANAMVQRIVRWSDSSPTEDITLQNALNAGVGGSAEARLTLQRAEDIAERAARIAPNDANVLKAHGFVLAAQNRIDDARMVYTAALEADPLSWPVLFNLAELDMMEGELALAVEKLERAYHAMDARYLEDRSRIGPWQIALGIEIGRQLEALKKPTQAEDWYREVLDTAPYNPEASHALASLLRRTGRTTEAAALCAELTARIGGDGACPV
ncbi:MAG: winged helix-turn-helix domain-containing protein [Pseudomonadota bacterium]